MEKQKDKFDTVKYLKAEKPFTGEKLLSEIFPLLDDYFEYEKICLENGVIKIKFHNGQRFIIKAEIN